MDCQQVFVEYKPFTEAHRERAKKHEARAEYWRSMGKPEYAQGSLRKAARARQAYREFDMWRTGALPAQRDESLFWRAVRHAERAITNQLEDVISSDGDDSGLRGLSLMSKPPSHATLPPVLTRQLRRQAERLIRN